MFTYVDHVHYAVRDCDAMVQYLDKAFGLKPDEHSFYDYRGQTMMKEAIYNLRVTQLQITEPIDWRDNPKSRMGKRVALQGPCVTHVGWGVEDIRKAAAELTARGTKTRGNEDMLHPGAKGYVTINVDPESSHGIQFQISIGGHALKGKEPMLRYVDHVHYAVRDRDVMVQFIERIFNMKPARVYETPENDRYAEYDLGPTKLRITSCPDASSAIGKFVATYGPGVYKLGWGVDDLQGTVQDLAAKGTRMRQREDGHARGSPVCDTDPQDSLGLVFSLVSK